MSATDFAWLVLAFPLAGSIVIGLGYRRWSGRTAGWIGTGAIALAFASSIGAFVVLLGEPEEERQLTSTRVGLRDVGRARHPARDPGGPALGRDVPDRHRRLDAHPPLLDRLHGLGPGVRAVLRLPQLLRLLDAAPGPRRATSSCSWSAGRSSASPRTR